MGDYASYDPRVAAATCAAARVFRKAGLDFGILYEGEYNSGNDVRLAGEEGLFETLRDKNLASFAKAHFDEVVTTDPHSFHVLKTRVPRHQRRAHGSASHATSQRSDPERRVAVAEEVEDDGDVPRSVLPGALQRHFQRSPPRDGRFGIGPRRDAAEPYLRLLLRRRGRPDLDGRPPVIKERPALTRVREAASLKGVHTLVVACPKDLVMFQDAIKTTGLEDKLEVKELIGAGGASHGVTGDSVRIGIYICHCGTNIAGTIDVHALASYCGSLPGVAVASEYKYMCSDPGQELIRQDIRDHG